MAFTEFFCDAATGANINAGDKTANGVVTSTNGGWSTVTNVFTANSGTPFSGVSVGDFASLYVDGATVAVYIARVTVVGGGGATLTVSATAVSGTAPTTSASARSCTTGGAWKGPNGASGFPFGVITAALTDSSSNITRINFKNGTNYAITAGAAHATSGSIKFRGYTATPGDGGRAIIDGGTSGTSFVLLNITGTGTELTDFILQNNGSTGTSVGLGFGGTNSVCRSVVINNVRGSGVLSSSSNQQLFVECEAYACNQSNTTTNAGFVTQFSGTTCLRCISHDNTGSNSAGFQATANTTLLFIDCIADSNGGDGLRSSGNSQGLVVLNCDFYNNTSDGIEMSGASGNMNARIESCNFIKNGGWGINGSANGMVKSGLLANNGYGSGTQANVSGTTTGLLNIEEIGAVTYASNAIPYVDAPNGDFRITLGASKSTGRGAFTQTASSYAGTVGSPDIGAAQHPDGAVQTARIYG